LARGGLGENHDPGDKQNFAEELNFNKKPNCDSHFAKRIQWIRMEELGKALTNRCQAVRELPNKKHKKQEGTRDRNTNSEHLEFDNAHTRPYP